jgi:hypothetical protein
MSEKRYYEGAYWPCINIKCYGMFDAYDFMAKYHCDEVTARHAVGRLQDMAFDMFWEDMSAEIKRLFGENARPIQLGRSGGWMSVSTLRDMTELKDYEDNADDPEEAQKLYEADTKALAELEEYCRAEIKAMEKLDYWDEYIKDDKLADGWHCRECGAFHRNRSRRAK